MTTDNSDNKDIILGVGVDSTSKTQVLNMIREKCVEKAFTRPLFIVTAYSENILECSKDQEFKKAVAKADLVVADGVSVAAAADYLRRRKHNLAADLWLGLGIGKEILKGKYAKSQVVGVDLARTLLKTGGERGWRLYLLGGFNGVAEKVAKMMHRDFPGVEIQFDQAGTISENNSSDDTGIVRRINEFAPDILLVALGRFKQEKWIAANLGKLKAKVVIGVGSSFDELAAIGPWTTPTPAWISRMGLKWLWRVWKSPKHIRRAINAFPLFPWKVFRSR